MELSITAACTFIKCKIKHNYKDDTKKITQPVLLQGVVDKFKIPSGGSTQWKTPSVPGEVLTRGSLQDIFNKSEQQIYQSGVGNILHLCKHSRPKIINSVPELSRFMDGAVSAQKKVMYQVICY